jgi:hypothetical protein
MGGMLKLSFDPKDTTGRESIFSLAEGKRLGIYLRAKVANPTTKNLGVVRLFLTAIERISAGGEKTVITSDTLPLNWAMSSGKDVVFYAGYEHFVDLATFTLGGKIWKPMTTRSPVYWPRELAYRGTYRMHLLLAGEKISPQRALFELVWPMKKLSPKCFLFKSSPKS